MSILGSIRSQVVPIHPEGYPFIGAFALASLFIESHGLAHSIPCCFRNWMSA